MFLNFIKNVYEKLIDTGYKSLNNGQDNSMISNETDFVMLEKAYGPNLFIVIIHNNIKNSIDYSLLVTSQISKQVNVGHMVLKFKQTIILNIFVTDDLDVKNSAEDLISKEVSSNSFVNNFYWNVHIDEINQISKLYIGDKQPSKILNLNEVVTESIKDMTYIEENPVSISLLIENARRKSKLKMVSKDAVATFIIGAFLFIAYVFFMPYKSSFTETTGYFSLFNLFPMVMYDDFIHFFTTIIWLFIFGVRIERYMGKLPFIIIFIFSSFIGNISTLLILDKVSIGATTGVCGLAGAMLILLLYVNKEVENFGLHLFLAGILMLISIGFFFPHVSNLSHIIGFSVGVIIAKGYFKAYNVTSKNINLE